MENPLLLEQCPKLRVHPAPGVPITADSCMICVCMVCTFFFTLTIALYKKDTQ